MTTYPRANTQAAWYQDNFPGATMDPDKGVIHTTEGTSLPGYQGGATAPNYTAVPNFTAKRLDWFAHFPDERSSRALRNLSGGVQTNTDDAIQVELVGTCDPRTHADWTRRGVRHVFWPEAPDWAYEDLARFIAWVNKTHGVPIDGPQGPWTPYPESFGAGGQRFSNARWTAFKGWCGHQHVPENSHGDPGRLPWEKIERMAKAHRASQSAGKPSPLKDPASTSPRWDAIYETARDALADLPKSATARRADLAQIMATARRWSTRY